MSPRKIIKPVRKRSVKTVHVATVVSIGLVLLLIGCLGVMLVYARGFSSAIKERVTLTVLVNKAVNDQRAIQFKNYLVDSETVSKAVFVSKKTSTSANKMAEAMLAISRLRS